MLARSPWFPFDAATDAADIQLFCLPPAAGAASRYRPWQAALAPRIDVVPVQLPGRESWFGDDPYTQPDDLVAALVEAIGVHCGPRFALFGHSMGALLAYELASGLAGAGRPPAHLFVSGYVPAHLTALNPGRVRVDQLSDEDLRQYLAVNSGVASDVLADAELMDIMLPLLRADLTVCENYRWRLRPPMAVPIIALGGDTDHNVTPELLARWDELTTGGFDRRLLPGGHHYLYENPPAITAVVVAALTGVCR